VSEPTTKIHTDKTSTEQIFMSSIHVALLTRHPVEVNYKYPQHK